MDRYYNCSGLCRELEVDYDNREIRAKNRDQWGVHVERRKFDVITHYEFEYVKMEWVESDKEDNDSRDHLIQLRETMRVNGLCEELDDFEPEEERLAVLLHYEVGLKLWYFYYQNSEVKTSSFYFSDKDAFEARRKLKPLIKYLGSQGIEDKNMFVGSEHLRIANIVSLNISASEFNHTLSSWREKENVMSPYVCLPMFGECSLDIAKVEGGEIISHATLVTKRRMNECEMRTLYEYMKESMPIEVYFDDGGYGTLPEPGILRHFWPLPQGEVHMHWNPYNNSPGLDYAKIELWDCARLQQIRDEEYWRSEVD